MNKLFQFFAIAVVVGFGFWGCKLEETADENQFFAEVVDLNGGNIRPLISVERPDGKIHVLFEQNGILGSALLSSNLKIESIKDYSNITNFSRRDQDITQDGGFIILGSNRVVRISPNQTIEFDKPVPFTNASASELFAIKTNSNSYIISGKSRSGTSAIDFPGTIKLSLTGEILGNITYNSPTTQSVISRYLPLAVAGIGSDKYCTIGSRILDTPDVNLVIFGGGIIAINTESLPYAVNTIGNKIFVLSLLSADTFGVHRYNDTGILEKALILNTFDAFNTSPQKPLINKDGSEILLIRNINQDSITFSSYDTETLNPVSIFNKQLGRSGGKVKVFVVSNTQTGYLLTCTFTNSFGQQFLYLIKTDEQGNTN
jgi:hypothetical protein